MADANSLVSLFNNIKLDDTADQHILEVMFPVRGLLPKDFEPALEPPQDLEDREAPPFDQQRIGVVQSLCRLRIPTEHRENPNAGFPDVWISLHNAFKSLTCGPGKSLLEAVIFYDNELKEDVIRLCLHTSVEGEADSHDFDFELSAKQWQRLVAEEESLWVKALDELMTRRSDRAYYHVRNRLIKDFGEEIATADEALWSARWGGTNLRQMERDEANVEDIEQLMEVTRI